MTQIASIIRKIAQQGQKPVIVLGTVTAIDTTARTIDVQPSDGSAPLLGVSLQSTQQGETGIVVWPKLESTVAVAMLTGYDAGLCILTDTVDKVVADVANQHLEMTADGKIAISGGNITIDGAKNITMNGGNNGGLINIGMFLETLNSIAMDLTRLSNAISLHTHVVTVNGSAITSAMTSTRVSLHNLALSKSSYEDTKVKH